MSETVVHMRNGIFAREDPVAMERRIFYGMWVTVALAVALSLVLAPWRITTGLLLGGILSLLNHHWLRTSIAAAFGSTAGRPRIRVTRFLFRYFIFFAIVAVVHLLNIVSLVATLFGMCSFVVPALLEAFMQTYFAIVYREGNS